MTGDIVNIGLSGEIALAREWLGRLGAPEQVSFSPGNHDALCPAGHGAADETFAPWSRGDDGAAGFPYLRRRGGVALIGLSSGVPTAPFVASGRLGAKQCADLAALLERHRGGGTRARRAVASSAASRRRAGAARIGRRRRVRGCHRRAAAPNWCCMATTTGGACIICRAPRKSSRRRRRFRLGEGRDASAWRRLSFVFDFARGRAVGHQGKGARRRQRERRIGGFGRARVVTPRVAFELFRNKLPGRRNRGLDPHISRLDRHNHGARSVGRFLHGQVRYSELRIWFDRHQPPEFHSGAMRIKGGLPHCLLHRGGAQAVFPRFLVGYSKI